MNTLTRLLTTGLIAVASSACTSRYSTPQFGDRSPAFRDILVFACLCVLVVAVACLIAAIIKRIRKPN